MYSTAYYSPDHRTARQRFRTAIKSLNWNLEEYNIGGVDPQGEPLGFEVAFSNHGSSDRTLVVSSGIHGAEAFFGSAVQLAMLENWRKKPEKRPHNNVLLLHGLNAYGFAWHRRFDENNVDPNRNFLLDSEPYSGSPPGYVSLNPMLNPEYLPSRWEPFTLKLAFAQMRMGWGSLKQAIASGQYDYSKGIFFGGHRPSRMHEILRQHFPRWLSGSNVVRHLDFHTGLGRWGNYKLLLDFPLSNERKKLLTKCFGSDAMQESQPEGIAYESRGGFDRWCSSMGFAKDYVAMCAEFGTYSPLTMLKGVRAENIAHHWSTPASAQSILAKRRLLELFCPGSPVWRDTVLRKSLRLIDQAFSSFDILD